jgi:hypothetical protein
MNRAEITGSIHPIPRLGGYRIVSGRFMELHRVRDVPMKKPAAHPPHVLMKLELVADPALTSTWLLNAVLHHCIECYAGDASVRMVGALVNRWRMKKSSTQAAYQKWLTSEAPVWVSLTKQVKVKIADEGSFAGGPAMYKVWAQSNRTRMVAKGEQDIGLNAQQVEVTIDPLHVSCNICTVVS